MPTMKVMQIIAFVVLSECICAIDTASGQSTKYGTRTTKRTTIAARMSFNKVRPLPTQYPIPADDTSRQQQQQQQKISQKPSTSSRNEVVVSSTAGLANRTKSDSSRRGVDVIDAKNVSSSKTRSTTTTRSVPTTSRNELKRELDSNKTPRALKKSISPKKYVPPVGILLSDHETDRKMKNTLLKENDDGPTKITFGALPAFSNSNRNNRNSNNSNKNSNVRSKAIVADKGKRRTPSSLLTAISLRERFNCPSQSEVKFDLFPLKCSTDKDCVAWKKEEICCDIFGVKSCAAGVAKPLKEPMHESFFGIPRKCPDRPLAELWWELKTCKTDNDCWPSVCCPDGQKQYCRIAQPELEIVPVPVKRSINYLSEYLECTAAPPSIFDLHPKPCNSTLDCFPNVCCQEAGKKHCRPPKKSLLTFMANFLNVGFVKRLTQNIVIK